MKSRLSLVLLLLGACSGPAADSSGEPAVAQPHPLDAYAATASQEAEVVETLQRLFDALRDGDADLLRAVMDPTVVMHSTETRDGQTTFGSATVEAMAERITSSDSPLIERMWEPVVVVNGALATIWTPYDFYVGSEFSHCGVDSANMLHTDDGWRIVALSWTRLQPPACGLHPDGPPAE